MESGDPLAGIDEPVVRGELARSGATTAPAAIATGQVLEHAIRHLAWLAREDEVVQAKMSEEWLGGLGALRS